MLTNVPCYGDSVDILRRYLLDVAVDLVYLEPPLNSKATRWNGPGISSSARPNR